MKLEAKSRLIASVVVAAPNPEVKKLKQAIMLRKQYEKLKADAESRSYTRSKTATKAAKDKFAAWKDAHPGYPTEKLRVLLKRLQKLEEQGSPDKKADRKAKETADKARTQELIKLNRQLDSALDQLQSTKDKDYDYTPEDTTPEAWVKKLKFNIADLRNRIKKLKAQK